MHGVVTVHHDLPNSSAFSCSSSAIGGLDARHRGRTSSRTMMPAKRRLRHHWTPPAGRHQTVCGRIPNVANASAAMAELPVSSRRGCARRWNIGVRERSDDGKSRVDRVFQPSNGESHRFQSPVNSERFR